MKKIGLYPLLVALFLLLLVGCSDDDNNSDGNDSFSEAISLNVNDGQYSSGFGFDNDFDYYVVTLEANKRYEIETFSIENTDTVLMLYNSSRVKVGYSDDKLLQSKIIFDCFEAGTYYIEAREFYGGKGQYSLWVTNVSMPTVTLPQLAKKWTLLVYLDGDNSLSDYTVGDVYEMINAGGSDTNINIVLLWDRLYTMSRYYYVTGDSFAVVANPGEVNMGDQQTAIDFIDFAVSNYPADNYGWVYWNHGSGVDRAVVPTRGVCWDETSYDDHLTETEQKNIISHFAGKISKKVSVVGYDACLMATAEHMYLNKDYADYFVASQANEPGKGWDYSFIASLKAKPSMEGDELATNILTKYVSYYASDSSVTFSVAALSNMDSLGIALTSFATAATNSGVSNTIFAGLASLANVGYFSSTGKDLFAYMNNVINSVDITNVDVKTQARTITNIIVSKLIVAEYAATNWYNKAHGVSITMKQDTDTYSQLDLAADTGWDEFISWAGFY